MKIIKLFLSGFFLTVSLLVACSEVRNPAKKNNTLAKAGTALNKETSANPDENKNSKTVYFKANGTEPFWSLEISAETVRFTSLVMDFEKFNAPQTEPIMAMDANVRIYRLTTEAGEMKINLKQMPCINDMSGKESRYQATVQLKRSIYKDFTAFNGCGNYITDYRLQDIWTLEELNGQPIAVEQYGKDRPRIEINTSQNSFMGVSGNHDINGKIFFENGLLRFTDIIIPQKGNAAEKEFIKNLQSANNYLIENNRLILFNASALLLQFKKTD